MRYGYTPDGKMRYEAAKRMTGLQPPQPPDPNPKPKSKPPVKEKNKRPASHQRQLAENKAINKKLTKLGGVAGMLGITRTVPKGPNESEAQWLLRTTKESFNGFSDVANGIKKVVKKVRG